jgi:hypothetical protein
VAQTTAQAAATAGTQAPQGTPPPNGTIASATAAATATAGSSGYSNLDVCFGIAKWQCCDNYNRLTDQSACNCIASSCQFTRQATSPVVWKDNFFGGLCRCA